MHTVAAEHCTGFIFKQSVLTRCQPAARARCTAPGLSGVTRGCIFCSCRWCKQQGSRGSKGGVDVFCLLLTFGFAFAFWRGPREALFSDLVRPFRASLSSTGLRYVC